MNGQQKLRSSAVTVLLLIFTVAVWALSHTHTLRLSDDDCPALAFSDWRESWLLADVSQQKCAHRVSAHWSDDDDASAAEHSGIVMCDSHE